MTLEDATVEPNVVTYSSLINAYANKGNSDGAEKVLVRNLELWQHCHDLVFMADLEDLSYWASGMFPSDLCLRARESLKKF